MAIDDAVNGLLERVAVLRDLVATMGAEMRAPSAAAITDVEFDRFSQALVVFRAMLSLLLAGLEGGGDADEVTDVTESVAALEVQVRMVVAVFREEVADRLLEESTFGVDVDSRAVTGEERFTAGDVWVRVRRNRDRLNGLADEIAEFGGMASTQVGAAVSGMGEDMGVLLEVEAAGSMPSHRLSSEELDYMDLVVDAVIAGARAGMAQETKNVFDWEHAVRQVVDVSDLDD